MNSRRRILVVSAAVVAVIGIILFFRLREPDPLKLPVGNHVPQISLGQAHGVVIAPDGTLWSWGSDVDVQWPVLGFGQTNGIPAASSVLRRIDSATNWVKVSAGFNHTLALKSDGSIWAWGANQRGQLGTGAATPAPQSSPVASAPGNDWMDVEAANECSYALKKDGSLWAWGADGAWRLGISASITSPVPVRIGLGTNWTKIRAGGVSAAGIQRDGSLWVWGKNPSFGIFSVGSTYNLAVPVRVGTDTNWVDVSVGFNIWMMVKSDGTLWALGNIPHDRTGAPESAKPTPTRIGTNSDWASVRTSQYGHLLRKRDGSFWKVDGSDLTSQVLISQGLPEFQKIEFPKASVADDIGGVASAVVTRGGEVWAQGRVMGEDPHRQRKLRERFIVWLEGLGLGSLGLDSTQSEEVVRNIEPEDPPK